MVVIQTPGSWNRAEILEINLNSDQKQSFGKSIKRSKQAKDSVFRKQ